jgi:cytochrome o ubiquinol oxidase subunit 3
MKHTEDSHLEAFSRTVFGFWVFLMSDGIMFAALFATYIVLNNTLYGPTTVEIFNLQWAFIQSLVLLTGSFACGPALLAAYHKSKSSVMTWLCLIFLLGVAFMAIEMADFSRLLHQGHSWETSGFLSAYFNLVGTHGFHVAIALLWTLVLIVQLMRYGITPVVLKRITCLRLFWHFLNIIWVFIFTFVYLLGLR